MLIIKISRAIISDLMSVMTPKSLQCRRVHSIATPGIIYLLRTIAQGIWSPGAKYVESSYSLMM